MSHIVQIQTEVRDPEAIRISCERLNLAPPQQGKFQLFASEVSGIGIQLSGWRYPVVCQIESGELSYDNYAGRWGEQLHLNKFLQAYAISKATIEAHKLGHSVTEQQLEDSSIKLTIQVGGAR